MAILAPVVLPASCYIIPVAGSLKWPPMDGATLDAKEIMKQIINLIQAAVVAVVFMSSPTWGEDQTNVDPLESLNRKVFAFNDFADSYVLRPVAKGYQAVTPDRVEKAVFRAFGNAREVNSAVNSVLQAKFGQAAHHSGRFLVNTTFGIAGFFDVATPLGLEVINAEDFGQTLAVWGVGSGPYIVLPLLGSSTLRDTPSRYVDGVFDPINQVEHIPTRNSIHGTGLISGRAELLKAESLISGDKYVFTREIYLQRRAYLINDGTEEDFFGDEYGDYDQDGSESDYGEY